MALGKTLVITESNTIIDGHGQTIDTDYTTDGIRFAAGVHDIELRNFVVRNSNYGWRSYNSTHNESRENDNYNITIRNCTFIENNLGGYVSRYSNHFTVKDCKFIRNGGTGLYFEHESNNNLVENNYFYKNGYRWHREYPKWMQKVFGVRKTPRLLWVQRAGLDIDGSARNTVRNNYFSENAASGIQMFTNGWEFHKSKPEYSLPRYTHSDHNKIYNNVFVNERVGVWIACRQYRDMTNWEYGTPQRESKWFWQVKKQPYPNWIALAALYHWRTENQPFRSPIRMKMNLWNDYADNNHFKENKFRNCEWEYIDNGKDNIIER